MELNASILGDLFTPKIIKISWHGKLFYLIPHVYYYIEGHEEVE